MARLLFNVGVVFAEQLEDKIEGVLEMALTLPCVLLARMKADCPLLASENGMEMWSYEDLMMQNKLKAESRNR